MNRAVALHPVTVIFVVLAGSATLGIVGGVIAVPFTAALKVVIVRVLAPAARHAGARHAAPASQLSEDSRHEADGPVPSEADEDHLDMASHAER